MSRRAFWAIAASMLALGAAVRINNVVEFPSLRAYDGFSHFSYIWFMADFWRVPLATNGWEFFQPPLYYWLMASVWDGFASLDPVVRLKLGTLIVALLGLSLATVSYGIVRRYFPGNRLVHLLAPGLMLFVPVHLYTAGFIGNENLTAVTCAWSLPPMLAVLRRPTPWRAAILGLMLGLAMLTKFTGIVVVVGALGTLGLRALVRGDWRQDGRAAAIAGVVMLVVCGWFYARNVAVYGTPFKMSRESFMLQRYEHIQTRGQRGFLEYVLFDPLILRRPEWPRGVPLAGDRFPGVPYSALRESVLTGVYANAWFEGYGGWVLPKISQDEAVRRSGQLLLTLGLVPSLLMLIGIWRAFVRLRRRGWDDTLVAMLLTFGAMMAILVQGTRAVPIHAAVKATYLMPVSVVFSFWFALGVEWLATTRPRWLKPAVGACTLLALASSVVFLQNRVLAPTWLGEWRDSGVWQNMYGVVYYAGGDTSKAREFFAEAAETNHHLGYENLSALALNADRPLEALHLLRQAARIQPTQTIGTPADQAQFNRLTRAEYLNTMAVIYHRLGWHRAALAAAQESVASDPTMPEAAYDLALLKLISATTGSGPADAPWRTAFTIQSRALLTKVIARDPAFQEARTLTGTLEALSGNCHAAVTMLDEARSRSGDLRQYPIITGVGDMHAAAVRRRRHIEDLPDALRPELERCLQQRGHDA